MEIKNQWCPFIPANCEKAGLKLNGWISGLAPASVKGEPMQELKDLDQSIKQFADSYQIFLKGFKFQIERIDEMERMLENFRRERGLETKAFLYFSYT